MYKKIALIFTVVIGLIGMASLFMLTTSTGSKFLINKVLSYYIGHKRHHIADVGGSILRGIEFENLEFKEIEGLPKSTILRIQRLFVKSASFNIKDLTIEVDNARIRIQSSDPIILNGNLRRGVLDYNLFGPGFGINEIKDFIVTPDWLKVYSGIVENIDLFIKGTLDEPELQGEVVVERLYRKSLSLVKVPLNVDLKLKKGGRQWQLFGRIKANQGKLYSRNTTVQLKESALIFNGSLKDFALDLNGESRIDNVNILIHIVGTRAEPKLILSSQPPLPRQALLVMLATGKRWEAVESAIVGEQLSPEIASDFVDYFLFDGQGQKIAKKFGIKDINVKLIGNTQGIGFKKSVTSKIDVGYGLEKTSATQREGAKTKQTVEGEYKITDKISVEMEKNIESEDKTNSLENEPNEVKSEDKVLLKYQKKF